MKKLLVAFATALTLGLAGTAQAQFCPGCIQNSSSPQNAEMNIGTATVRGTTTMSTATITWANITNLVVANLSGNGSAITNLNASNLASGVVAAARLVGSYTGITGVGTLAAGVWNGTIIGTQYGGTGNNWSTKTIGHIPFFSTTGTLNTLAPGSAGQLLQTNGAAAPSYTSAPSVFGTNVTAIPLANLQSGTLSTGIAVQEASLPGSISGSRITGNIAGGAATLTVPLPVANLAAGQLPTTNPASSVTASGVTPGTYGGPIQMAQVHINGDGRIDVASQSLLAVPPANISAGEIPAGVTIPATQISTGTLHDYVVASSIAATGAVPGTYGDATRTVTAVVRSDGRLNSMTQQLIAINPSQINAGALPSNITVPATSISAGQLANNVVASSLTNSGVTPGTYGGLTQIPQVTVGLDGRVTSATQFLFPALSTSTVASNIDNAWTHSQTFLGVSSITLVGGNISANVISAANFSGSGSGITFISPFVIGPGALPANVIASSVGVNTISNPQVAAGANIAQSKIAGLSASFAAKASSGTNNDITDLDALVTATATGQIEAGGFFTPGASTAAYFYGNGANLTGISAGACASSGTFGVLCQGEDNHLSNAVGVPNTHGVVAGGQLNIGNADGNGGYNVISGGYNNVTNRSFSTISGGRDNTVGYTATVGGGISNNGTGDYATVAGGNTNIASGNSSSVAGGASNTASGSGTAIGGGGGNVAASSNATIAGGVSNHALHTQTAIGGGQNNYVTATFGVIAGGQENTVSADFGSIGSGFQNVVSAAIAAVGSGDRNSATAGWAHVGGGKFNVASGLYSEVGGGNVNVSTGDYSTVGGGFTNTISGGGSYSTISGGKLNVITSPRGVIGGGDSNTSSGDIGVIGGGIGNSVTATGGSVLGGQSNTATAIFGTVGGGQFNSALGQYGTVSGGQSNSNSNERGVIAGGVSNTITLTSFGVGSVIGGGQNNTLSNVVNTQGAVIAGGGSNTGGGAFSVISGGSNNSAPGGYSVVPGGDLNVASGDYSYAAGRRAKATAQGSFVLADSQNVDLVVTATDTLHVRFQGGANFEVGTSTFTGILSIGAGNNIIYYCTGSTAGTYDGNLARGNGNAGACAGGTWVATSLHTD